MVLGCSRLPRGLIFFFFFFFFFFFKKKKKKESLAGIVGHGQEQLDQMHA